MRTPSHRMLHEHLRVLDRAQITQLALAAHVVVAAEARARPSDNLPGDAISFPDNLSLFLSLIAAVCWRARDLGSVCFTVCRFP
jgi:hypothetical protein